MFEIIFLLSKRKNINSYAYNTTFGHLIIRKMGINYISRLFMPKNTIFYELFEEVAKTVVEMGTELKMVVIETDRDKRVQIIKK